MTKLLDSLNKELIKRDEAISKIPLDAGESLKKLEKHQKKLEEQIF